MYSFNAYTQVTDVSFLSVIKLLPCACPHGLTFTCWGCCGLCQRHKPTEIAHSFLFYSCIYFCLYGPFNCISFHKFSRQLPAFSLCSSSLHSASSALSTIYLCMKVSLSPDIILCGWLGLKHQLFFFFFSLCIIKEPLVCSYFEITSTRKPRGRVKVTKTAMDRYSLIDLTAMQS